MTIYSGAIGSVAANAGEDRRQENE